MEHRIRPAGTADIDALMGLRVDAEEWLRSIGSSQWSDPQTANAAIAKWHSSINEGRTWVVVSEGDQVDATITLGPADRDFWAEADQPNDALYVYKLMVRRTMSGMGLGDQLLDWAGRNAVAQAKRWIRCDVWRDAPQLQRYYLNRGFRHVRTEAPQHRLSGWLAQRPAELLLNPWPLATHRETVPAQENIAAARQRLETAARHLRDECVRLDNILQDATTQPQNVQFLYAAARAESALDALGPNPIKRQWD
jgi:GNAT superfamily N-acetyltransferase